LTSSTFFRRLIEWFACTRLSESHLPRSFAVTFPKRSLPWLFTNAALGGLKPAPASRLRGAHPHLLCSYAHFIQSALVAHYIENITTLAILKIPNVYHHTFQIVDYIMTNLQKICLAKILDFVPKSNIPGKCIFDLPITNLPNQFLSCGLKQKGSQKGAFISEKHYRI
jgi:hypothetical protein